MKSKIKDPKDRVGVPFAPQLRSDLSGDFVGAVDRITFGVLGGKSFHTGSRDWSHEDIALWATANGLFFSEVGKKLAQFAAAIQREIAEQCRKG